MDVDVPALRYAAPAAAPAAVCRVLAPTPTPAKLANPLRGRQASLARAPASSSTAALETRLLIRSLLPATITPALRLAGVAAPSNSAHIMHALHMSFHADGSRRRHARIAPV